MSNTESTAVIPVPSNGETALIDHIIKSRYFKDVQSVAQAAVRIRLGRALGLDEASAMMGLFINAQGKLSMSANLMARCIKAKLNPQGKRQYKYKILEHTDKKCSIQVWERLDDEWDECGPPEVCTIEQFKFLAVGPNKANWTNYPKNMLFARAITNIAKFFCADAFGGSPVYLPDEIPNSGLEVDGATLEVKAAPASSTAPVIDAEVTVWSEAHAELERLMAEAQASPTWLKGALGVGTIGELSEDGARRGCEFLRKRLEFQKKSPASPSPAGII
jgi:hypothetical protein